METNRTFVEFFAGGGMARLGLGPAWRCLLANDLDPGKCAAYRANFGGDELIEGDIAALGPEAMPTTRADLVWGSFPCQDLSLAGARGGMAATRSGAFFPFWNLVEGLAVKGRAPRIVAVENVVGLLTSNGGRDFAAVVDRMAHAGYSVTACVLDAKTFTPQSRPRLFILGFAPGLRPPASNLPPTDEMAPAALVAAREMLSANAKSRWFWLAPAPRSDGRALQMASRSSVLRLVSTVLRGASEPRRAAHRVRSCSRWRTAPCDRAFFLRAKRRG